MLLLLTPLPAPEVAAMALPPPPAFEEVDTAEVKGVLVLLVVTLVAEESEESGEEREEGDDEELEAAALPTADPEAPAAEPALGDKESAEVVGPLVVAVKEEGEPALVVADDDDDAAPALADSESLMADELPEPPEEW